VVEKKYNQQGPLRQHFHQVYEGKAPWDIGRPQPAFVKLADTGKIKGSVLDVGSGTGDNALLFAEHGHYVLGIDMAPTAVEIARKKAASRGLDAAFRVADALELQQLERTFDTVLDSGLFHIFSNEERLLYVTSLVHVTRPGGFYYLLCFSDLEPQNGGPRRIRQDEIREAFSSGWTVQSIQEERFEDNLRENGARAWLAAIKRE